MVDRASSAGEPGHRKWVIALLAMVAMIPSSPGIVFYSQNLFLEPVTRAFGWTQTQFYAPISAGIALGAIAPPFLGYAADKWGVRPVQLPLLILFGLGAMAWGLIGSSLVVYWIVSLIAGLASASQSPMFYAKVVAGWFDRHRGLALSIATCGLALGNMIVPPFTAFLLREYDWRIARAVLGASVLLIAVPVVWFFLKERVVEVRTTASVGRADDAPIYTAGLTFRESLGTFTFWKISGALVLGSFAINSHLGALGPLVRSKGMEIELAAVALSLMAITQLLGRLFSGQMLDKVHSPRIGALWFAFITAGLLMLHWADSPGNIYVAAALLGLALGAEIELAAYYVTRYFGLKSFGTIYGSMICLYGLAAAVGPMLMGFVFDHYGDYTVASMSATGASIVATLLLILLPAYRYVAATDSEPDRSLIAAQPLADGGDEVGR